MKSRRGFVFTGLASLLPLGGTHQSAFASQQVASNPALGDASDWSVASPDSQGIANSALESVLDAAQTLRAMRSVLVVRNGTLIAERYYWRTSASDILHVNSVTKSVASILTGLALQRGAITSLSATVGALLPDAAAKLPTSAANSVTLAQILTGTSGLAYDWRTQFELLDDAPDPVLFVQSLPSESQTPPVWSYNDAAISLISPILERAMAMPIDAFAERDLFSPLGIKDFGWTRDSTGRCMSHWGLKLRPRDLAKIVWTVANGGQWRGVQVLPRAWIDDSTRPHVPVRWRIPPISDAGYGYLWFTGNLNGDKVAWAWGYGGQFAVIVPSFQLVIITSANYPGPADLSKQQTAVMSVVAQIVELVS